MRRILKEIGRAIWLPALAGAVTFAITWLAWFLIDPPCVPAPDAPCPLLPWGRYITRAILTECIRNAVFVMTVTGGSDIMLFIREFKRNEEQRLLNEQQKQDSAARLEQEKQDSAARLEQEKQAAEQRRADDQQRWEQQRADDRQYWERIRAEDQKRYEQDQKRWEKEQERADRLAEKREALLEQSFQLLQEERNAAETARQAAAAERRQQDERIRRLEMLLAQQPTQTSAN